MTAILVLGLTLAGAPAKEAPVEKKVTVDGAKGVVTARSFRRIRAFVLAQGRRQTWCNMFNDNPHWSFESFDAFLNPPDQRNINCVVGRSEFPTLVIRSKEETGQYWHITLAQKGERLTLSKRGGDDERLVAEIEGFFREALAVIERIETGSDTTVPPPRSRR